MPYVHVEESFINFLDPDPEAADFQNLISSFLSTDTQYGKHLVKFSRRSNDYFSRKVDKREKGRQTNPG